MRYIKDLGIVSTRYTYRVVIEAAHKKSLTEQRHISILDDELEELDIMNMEFIGGLIHGIDDFITKKEKEARCD